MVRGDPDVRLPGSTRFATRSPFSSDGKSLLDLMRRAAGPIEGPVRKLLRRIIPALP